MGEIEEKLGRALTVLLVNFWRTLDPQTQHQVLVCAIVIGSLGFLIEVVKWLREPKPSVAPAQRAPITVTSESPSLPRVYRPAFQWVRRPANPLVIPSVLLLLLAALGTWPYNFYVLTRIIVCATAVLIALLLHSRRMLWWEVPIVVIALLFNPVAPFHFTKDVWRLFNVLAALMIAPAIFVSLKQQPKLIESAGPPSTPATVSSAIPASTSQKYRYCGNCSVRVGRADLFCKRCGSSLQR